MSRRRLDLAEFLRPVICYLAEDADITPSQIADDLELHLPGLPRLSHDAVEKVMVEFRWGQDMFRRRWWDRGWDGDLDTGGPVVTHEGGEVVQ